MRVWEFEDNKAAPSNLVREQDFILRVRRMQRHSTPCLVLNFVLSAIDQLNKDRTALELVQKKLQEHAQKTSGAYFEMSNGDAFVVWENSGDSRIVSTRAIEAALSEYVNNTNIFLFTYHMPKMYELLRERTNFYVDLARTATPDPTGDLTHVDIERGHLTAKNVDQIEHLLGEIDLRRYGRMQNIYRDVIGKWVIASEEYFVSFDDLRRERFPKLELVSSEHFFFAICSLLDRKLLAMLTASSEQIAGRKINLNLSISSIVDTVFVQFVKSVPQDKRDMICFELHSGDLLQDFALTLSAIEILKREGFRVAIDSVTLDMINYIDFTAFAVDAIKINVSQDRALLLANGAVRKGLAKIAPEKIIFFRCDNQRALVAGRELGVSLYQGWLIDKFAGVGKKP